MNWNTRILLLVGLLIGISFAAVLPTATAQPENERCFAATGQCMGGRIGSYWEQNGGLAVFGYPIAPQTEMLIEGEMVTAQWFERNRLELHPENDPPYDVQLGRLGAELLPINQGKEWYEFPPEGPLGPQARCRHVWETRHNICQGFLATWRSNGLEFDGAPGLTWEENLALFGLPLTGVITETLSDGQVYQVQYFERARFEYHPENDPPYDVLLGLLGNERRAVEQTADQPPPPPTPLTAGSNPEYLTVVGDRVYFVADDGIHGNELWQSDGTTAGTALVRDIRPGAAGSFPVALTNVNGTLFFGVVAPVEGIGTRLWQSDGTAAGTTEVQDPNGTAVSLYDRNLIAGANRLFFVSSQAPGNEQVWVSDGTPTGTGPLTATPGGIYPMYAPSRPETYQHVGLTAVGDSVYFAGNTADSLDSYALWRSDGTPDGTVPVVTVSTEEVPGEYWDLTDAGGTLFFLARTGETTYALWRSDGTPEGTRQVRAFERPEPLSSGTAASPPIRIVAALGNRVYLLADPTTAGPAGVWTSDGTPAGTVLVTDDTVETATALPDGLYYLTRPDTTPTIDLRRISDPGRAPATIAQISVQRGTTQLESTALTAAGEGLSFALNDPGFSLAREAVWPAELWRSDGTPDGTIPVATIARSWAARSAHQTLPATDHAATIVEMGGIIYLVGNDGVYGRELWRSDGTAAGTWLVHDSNTRPAAP